MDRLSWAYWFRPRLVPLTPLFLYIFIGIIVVLFLAACLLYFLQKKSVSNKKIYISLYYFSLANFLIGLFLFFFRFEGLAFMTARYWLVLWFLSMAYWLYSIWKKYKNIPQKRENNQRLEEYLKYLPRKK